MMGFEWMLTSLAAQFPILIVCSAGLVWALLRLDKQPRAALLVLGGLGLYIVIGIGQTFLQGLLQNALSQVFGRDPMMGRMPLHYAMTAFAFNVIRAISLGLLALAAFVDRPMVQMGVPQQPLR